MAPNGSNNNFFFAIGRFVLFLLLCFFVCGISYQFVLAVHAGADVNILLLPGAVFFTFCYYLLIRNLNDGYKKIQTFFFRNPIVSYACPFLLVVAAAICLVLVKLFGLSIDRSVFVLTGGFILAAHLIYVSGETRGDSFPEFSGYLLNFTLFYLVNLVLLGVYFNFLFHFNVIKALLDGLRLSVENLRHIIL